MPELLPYTDILAEPDVKIILGIVPSEISGAVEANDIYQVARDKFFYRVRGVGNYYVTDGNCILVEPDEQAEERFVRVFLLGTAFAAMLLQRGVFPLHGSAIVFDGYCAVFTGATGAGKSTLSAALRERGYPLLTDDVAVVSTGSDGVARVQPGFPLQKLWRDSAEVMGADTSPDLAVFVGNFKDKFMIPVDEGFCSLPVPLGAIYELVPGKSPHVTIKRFSAIDKLTVLMNNIYRGWLIEGLDRKTEHFKSSVDMAGKVSVSSLTRPEGIFSLEDQMRLIRDDLHSLFPDGFSL